MRISVVLLLLVRGVRSLGVTSRRGLVTDTLSKSAAASVFFFWAAPCHAFGDPKVLKTYDDALFEVTFPSDFFAIRRTISGDVVRRGNVIFTAGRYSAAEVVTVEYFQVADLIAQADAKSFFPDNKIKRWRDLGTNEALAEYLCERRDNEATVAARGEKTNSRASTVRPDTLKVTDDTIEAEVVTAIGSMEMRVGEGGAKATSMGLTRRQKTRYTLLPDGKTVIAIWAGCLDDLWDSGEGQVLQAVVDSFTPKKDAVLA